MFEYFRFFILQAISKGGKFFFEIAPSFIMGSIAYGEYVYLLSVGMLIASLTVIGLPISLLRLVPEWKKHKPKQNIAPIIWDIQFTLFLFVSIILYFILIQSYSIGVVLGFILFIFSYSLIQSYPTILRATGQIKKWFFYQETLLPFLSSVVLVVLIFIYQENKNFTLLNMIWLMAILSVITAFVALYKIYKFHGNIIEIRSPFSKETLEVVKISMPMFFTGFTYLLLSRLDIIMLNSYIDKDILGGYNIVARFSLQTLFIWQIISSYFMPKISQKFVDTDISSVVTLHRKYLFLSIVSTALLSLSLIVIVRFVDITQYVPTWNEELLLSMYILLVGQFISVVFSGYGYMLLYIHKEKYAYVNSIIMISVAVVANLILIPTYGVLGASWATLFAIIIVKILEICEIYWVKRTIYL